MQIQRGTQSGCPFLFSKPTLAGVMDWLQSITVHVGPNPVPAVAGDAITVIGTVDDDGPLELYATRIIRADGTWVELPHQY